MGGTFDERLHEKLVDLLAASDFVEDYRTLCKSYEQERDIDGPRLDMARTVELFRNSGALVAWNKKFKVVQFDREEVAGWQWEGSLVIQRYDMLELMLKGIDADGKRSVGSTWLDLASEAGVRRIPPVPPTDFLPPVVLANRPQFDGDMATMERMVPDIIALFRKMKGVVRAGW
jgi:hypothetical protein